MSTNQILIYLLLFFIATRWLSCSVKFRVCKPGCGSVLMTCNKSESSAGRIKAGSLTPTGTLGSRTTTGQTKIVLKFCRIITKRGNGMIIPVLESRVTSVKKVSIMSLYPIIAAYCQEYYAVS